MTRAYNFCAGPAALPEPVLARARDEMLDWQGRGLSVMEMSHRSEAFMGIAHQAEQDLRELLAIPDNYRVLFMQGGASSQFAMVPLNLLSEGGHADYVDTGIWSRKAIAEGRRFGDVRSVASAESNGYVAVPDPHQWALRPGADYLHITPNETIGGLAYPAIPQVGDSPLVADLSSAILSEPLDVSRFGLIYAGAQKNIGPAGLTLVIVREDLIKPMNDRTPAMMSYEIADKNDSMYNTPPTYAWYLAGLVFQWLKEQGGLEAMGERNRNKAGKLYDAIDRSDFYNNPIRPDCRSLMNVPFTLADERLNSDFLAGAEARRLLNLKGHRSVGGMRASLYNAMPEAGVDALIDFMREFEKERA
ncbi:MAG: 3-phosphoserine/phosphohydroxythreonine transaminase [Oleiphilaceae bacterium]|nr:3-phosphoserine/phosphohydroxythreonine transaminase [Oleiphilaceae bacterium]